MATRFNQLVKNGMSKEDAWKVMAVEVLAGAGIIAAEHLEPSPAPTRTELFHIPVVEAKLVKVIRIEPSDDDRIRALLGQARTEAAVSKGDSPSESSVIRRALRLGLDALEREHSQK